MLDTNLPFREEPCRVPSCSCRFVSGSTHCFTAVGINFFLFLRYSFLDKKLSQNLNSKQFPCLELNCCFFLLRLFPLRNQEPHFLEFQCCFSWVRAGSRLWTGLLDLQEWWYPQREEPLWTGLQGKHPPHGGLWSHPGSS